MAALKEIFVQKLNKNLNLIWSLRSKPQEIKPASNLFSLASEYSAYLDLKFEAPRVVLESHHEEVRLQYAL